jgi:hypothetical protein
MKAEVRQLLGKAAYEGTLKYLGETGRRWDILGKEVQEAYCIEAEEVVRQLAAMIGVPILQLLLSEDDVKSILEQCQ